MRVRRLVGTAILYLVAVFPAIAQTELPAPPFTRTVIEDFESAPDWSVSTFEVDEWGEQVDDPDLDLRLQIRPGAPADMQEFEANGIVPIELDAQQSVLGLRIESSRAARHGIHIAPDQPPALEAVPVGIDIWVSGDNSDHQLQLLLLDGDEDPFAEVYLGRTNFLGWKRMSRQFRLDVPEEALPLHLGGLLLLTDPFAMGGIEYLYFDTVIMTFPAELGSAGGGNDPGGGDNQ